MSQSEFTISTKQRTKLIKALVAHAQTITVVPKWKHRKQLTAIFDQYKLPLSVRRFMAAECRGLWDQIKREAHADQYL